MKDYLEGPLVVVPNDGAYVKRDDMATLRIEERATPDELIVALIVTDCPLAREKAAALARLFVAAPEMFAACEDAIDLIEAWMNGPLARAGIAWKSPDKHPPALIRLRDAVARVTLPQRESSDA